MNQNKVVVSICCLAYNHEEYIAEALESLVGQRTDFPFEIICNDDASTDSTSSIIEEYANRYPAIIKPIFQERNQRKNGGDIIWDYFYPTAQGKYIAYCDGDDYWITEDRLQKQVDFLESNRDYSLCLTNYYYLFGNKMKLAKTNLPSGDVPPEKIMMWENCPPQLNTCLFRKSDAANRPDLFKKIGGGDGSMLSISDLPLFIYLSLIGKVYFSPEPTSVWRRHGAAWGYSGTAAERAQYRRDEAKFYEKLNQYTDYKYDDVIIAKINACNVLAAACLGDYKTAAKLQKNSTVGISEKRKLVNSFGAYFPNAARFVERIKIKHEIN